MNLISALPSQEEGAVASRREEGSSDASGEGEAQIKEGFALRVQRLMQLKEREKELGLGEGQGLGRATIDGVKIWFVS